MMSEQNQKSSHVFYRYHKRALPSVSHGKGIYLWDTSGKQYIDASGGAVVVNLGHGVEEIADAMRAQASIAAYAHPTMFTTPAVEQLATRLAARLPMPVSRVFFMSSGSEATETAIKIARQIQIARGEPTRYKVIGRWGSYHGATLGALAVTGKPSMRRFFEPLVLDMPHIPPVYCYRCPFGLRYPTCAMKCAEALEDELHHQGENTVAAFIAEPIAGATLGAVVPPAEYWPRIREICDRHGVLLIDDEVMTGMGRTGKWFAMEHWNVTPDIANIGKGISSGYAALSAIAVRSDWVNLLWEKTGEVNHGGTFSHHPVAAAAGLATLKLIEDRDLVTRVAIMGKILGRKLSDAFGEHDRVGDVRGAGLMWALEIVADRKTNAPYPVSAHLASRITEQALSNGLIVYTMSGCADGTSGDHVMIAPPFIVEENQIDEIVERLETALDAAIESING